MFLRFKEGWLLVVGYYQNFSYQKFQRIMPFPSWTLEFLILFPLEKLAFFPLGHFEIAVYLKNQSPLHSLFLEEDAILLLRDNMRQCRQTSLESAVLGFFQSL